MAVDNIKKFKKLFLEEANLALLKEKRTYEIDGNNCQILEFLFAYFSGSDLLEEKYNGRFSKGILLHGNIGVGKSFFFEVLDALHQKHKYGNFAVKNVSTLALMDETIRYLSNPGLAQNDRTIYQRYSKSTIHFEDLGHERKINHFGNSIEIMDEYLLLRYNEFRKTGLRTYITTNLNLKEIEKRYSPQVYDRLFQMFNVLEMSGDSRRR